MSRRPHFQDFIDDELLRVPMTLDAVIDAVHGRWRLRLPPAGSGFGDPARTLHQHRGELIAQTLRTLRETAQADLSSDFSLNPSHAVVPGLAQVAMGRTAKAADLSLIDEDDVVVDIEIARCTQAIKQAAEAELRDLHTYTSALVHDVNVARDTNPFGPERYVRALWQGVQQLPLGRPVQAAFMHDAAGPLAEALRKAYASASQRLQAQGVAPAAYRTFVFGSGTAWGADLVRYRPSEDPHPQPASPLPGRPAGPAAWAPAAHTSPLQQPLPGSPGATVDPQTAELLARLFDAMLQERGLAEPTQALLRRLHGVVLRLVQTDPTPLDTYDHAAWRFTNQLVFDIECCPPAQLPRLLSLSGSLVDHLASAEGLSVASFTWAIVRLAAARQHALEQALMAAAPQLEQLQRIASDQASAATAAVPLDIGSLDTVPAGLMPEPAQPAPASDAFSLLQAAAPGSQLRCHLQGRWRHLMALWHDTDNELVLLQEPPSGQLWALRQSAFSRLLAERLARPLRVRSLVRRAADRQLRSAGSAARAPPGRPLGAGLRLRLRLCLAALCWALAPAACPAPADPAPPIAGPASPGAPFATPPAVPPRPRIGLVLSGGGARGLAHVGVLKVLEQMQVPIDLIAGTSMGAIVGGLYASGMGAAELERELRAVRWTEVFASRVERQLLSQRRKEEDFEISPLIELGLKGGELVAPTGAVSSRGLESLLRRYTLPVRGVPHFDQLPIAFRAVATDMESGAAVVLDHGDLALALRSSMSVPGLFSPTELGGRVLGDGGLVNNVPVDVARALGADVVIVVNIGTPLGGRDSLVSAVGLTGQMINILTEQNVQRSLATLKAGDVLINPVLGTLGSGDFDQAATLMALGEAGARGRSDALAGLSLSAPDYAAWRAGQPRPGAAHPVLAAVRIEGSSQTNPDRLLPMLDARPGQRFDPARAELDARRLAAGGDYTRADYQLVPGPQPGAGDALVFELEDKPWGPNYLHAGLDLSTDFGGRSAFNLKLSHNRHWLTPQGTEWRNRLQIGEVPQLFTEVYHPLAWARSRAEDWFVAGYAGLERRRLLRYGGSGDEVAEFQRSSLVTGLDIGQPWGDLGEFRFGWSRLVLRTAPQLVSAGFGSSATITSTSTSTSGDVRWTEDALRARLVVDQLDYAVFPQSGYRGSLEAWAGQRSGGLQGRFHRIEADGLLVRSFGAHSLQLSALVQTADQQLGSGLERYRLGGFHQLSGYQAGQLTGNHALLLRLGWYRRLSQTPTLTRGFFVGGTLEAGNAWAQRSDIALTNLRTGMSVFLGADTGIGPLYLGLTWAPEQRRTALALFIGRP